MKDIILPDIVSAGIYNTQLVYKNRAVTPNRKTVMFEIEIPIEDGGISYINDSSHPISKNTVICAKPGELRHTKLPFKCYYVHMIVNEGQLFHLLSSLPDYIEIEDEHEMRELFAALCECHHSGSATDEVLAQSLLLRLIYTLDKTASSLKRPYKQKPSNQRVIEESIAYIKANLSGELNLDALSERFNFSKIYFHKLFKASTGKTLHEYVEDQRIKKSINLMISTDMTLTRIAYECGFSSQSYFSYAFKKKTGATPRKYAEEIQSKYETIK